MLWDEPMQQGDALFLCEPQGFKVLPLLAGASPSFSSFLLEKLLLNNSVQLLSAPRAGAAELMLEEDQPVPSCWGKGRCTGLCRLLSSPARPRAGSISSWHFGSFSVLQALYTKSGLAVPQSSWSCQIHPGLKQF